jgi:hypothetical protein
MHTSITPFYIYICNIYLFLLGSFRFSDSKLALKTVGTKIPVHFENQVINASLANLGTLIDAAKLKSKLDYVFALVKVVSTEDDQVLCCPLYFAISLLFLKCMFLRSFMSHYLCLPIRWRCLFL